MTFSHHNEKNWIEMKAARTASPVHFKAALHA